ncbi:MULTISPECIES: glycosyltransferase family 2 protein [unclassified Streptomyces]|uniref:glycosyltransferase family 2 protein n=1 Tax=unclassified Streptomyces TaxID=2593676 RepID=UPI002E351A32|nr:MULTISPECIES: glycosyltransferase [unclassified Streptomyces]
MPTESWPVLLAVAVLVCTALAALPVGSRHKRAAPGRVLAIVSVRVDEGPGEGEGDGDGGRGGAGGGEGDGGGEGATARLYATVRSLTGQSRPVDAVHVVDDGSAAPVVPFEHPSVTWHRLPGVGRRAARATVVRRLRGNGRPFDYVLTVDAGSEVHKDAVWQMLRVLNDRRVQACTGTVLTRDRHAGLTARLTDLRLFVLCVLGRGLRSAVGAARPAPGGVSLYRMPVLSDHLEHYVSSGGTAGDDDRQLCGYARSRGRVVSVPRAYVTADAPGTLGETYRQQLRRAGAVRRLVPWELLALPASARTARLVELGAGALLPLLSLGLVAEVRRTGSAAPLLHALAGVGVFTLAEALLYAVLRPGLSRTERLTAPLLAPLHAAMMFFVVHPATYRSLVGTRHADAGVREVRATARGDSTESMAEDRADIRDTRDTRGASDASGPRGRSCPEGPSGPAGPVGSVGSVGSSGRTGPVGSSGPEGPSGGPGTPEGPRDTRSPGAPRSPEGPRGPEGPRTPRSPGVARPAPGPAKLLDPLTEQTLETPLRIRTAHPD